MRGTPVLLVAAAVGMAVGAWMAGAPLYTLLASGAAAFVVSAAVMMSVRLTRGEARRILIEIFKLEMMQSLPGRSEQPIIDLDDLHMEPVKVGDIEALIGVSGDAPLADATMLRFPLERARRKGVAS
jgi:hypothetical protein